MFDTTFRQILTLLWLILSSSDINSLEGSSLAIIFTSLHVCVPLSVVRSFCCFLSLCVRNLLRLSVGNVNDYSRVVRNYASFYDYSVDNLHVFAPLLVIRFYFCVAICHKFLSVTLKIVAGW